MNWLDFFLNFIVFSLSLLLAVLGGFVTTKEPKHRRLFVVIAVLSSVVYIPSQISAYHTTKHTEQDNRKAAENQIKLLQEQRSLQQDQRSLQQVAQNLMARVDSLTSQALTKGTAKPASLRSSVPVGITFKDSALFTSEKKAFIIGTIKTFRDYLVALKIPVPAEPVPIGTLAGKPSSIERSTGATYRDNIMLGKPALHDEAEIIKAYSDFVIQEVLRTNVSNKGDLRVYRAGTIIATYYSLSFRSKRSDKENDPWVPVLWKMRDRFGREYTDRMIAFTLRVVCDEPSQRSDANFDTYFAQKTKDGNSVLDNNGGKRQEIDKILKSFGLQISSED